MHNCRQFIKNILLLSALHACTILNAIAQLQPAYITRQNTDGLHSNSIYYLHVAKNGILYIAHTKGLSSYDGGAFKNYYNKDYPYTEVSNILELDNGEIYCKAFNNVLYKVEKDSLHHFLNQLNNSGFSPSACYQNTLISLSNDTIIFYNTTTKKVSKHLITEAVENTTVKDIVFTCNKEIDDTTVLIKVDKNYHIYKESKNNSLVGNVHFYKGEILIGKNKSVENTYLFSKKSNIIIKSLNKSLLNFFTTTDSTYWICTTNGLYYFNKNDTAVHYILPGINTTAVIKTVDNYYVVSTLGSGLIVIPDFQVNILPNTPPHISKIACANNQLLIGTNQGSIYQYNVQSYQQTSLFKSKSTQAVKHLFYDKANNNIIASAEDIFTNNENILIKGSLKDYAFANNAIVFATNAGIYVYANDIKNNWLNKFVDKQTILSKYIYKLNIFNEYVASLKYDNINDRYFINTYQGLFELNKNKVTYTQLADPKNCSVKDIYVWNGELLLATKDKGILKWNGTDYLSDKTHYPSNGILIKFEEYKNQLWLLGEENIFCYTNNKCIVYNNPFKNTLKNAINISVSENYLYVTNGDNIIQIPKKNTSDPQYNSNFILNSIKNNAGVISDYATMPYTQNDIVIQFSLINFSPNANVHIAYSINGQAPIHLQNNIREIYLNNLSPDNYNIQFFTVTDNIISNKPISQVTLTIQPPFYKSIWFTIFLISLSILAVFLIAKSILTNWKKKALQKETQMLLEKELDKSMLTSIKAQMNPHFLFNALNTIQSYIYSNDKQNASMYISKFSDLTRSILEMSNSETISLEEEIKSLRLYLELEKMRFEDSFDYFINIDSTLQKEQIKIPSMLVQPYIENAIKHGLLHKKTNRILNLNFTKENNVLIISIDDNGIGRKKSQELNKIKNRQHTSFAMDANKKRLEILKNNFAEINFEIIDKLSPLGEPLGTKVIIKLPI